MTLILGVLGIAPAQAAVSTNPNAQTWTVLVGNQSVDKGIQGMRFLPGENWIHQTDSISFEANSAEIHTVSYGDPGQVNINNLLQVASAPVGGPVFDPTASWTNSGLIANGGPSYQLKFADPGTFTFYCLLHGKMMNIVVHVMNKQTVLPHKQTALPHKQAYYDSLAKVQSSLIIADGLALEAATKAKSSSTHVFVGAMDDEAMVMRFIPSVDNVPVGTKVTFDMSANQGLVPHTVTFTSGPAGATLPDSGLLLPAFPHSPVPSTFDVTFNRAGAWNYLCEFHDDLGMVGSVNVRGAS